jgi:4-carboxymuconolactone decarboxylase
MGDVTQMGNHEPGAAPLGSAGRLHRPIPAELTPDQRMVYDAIVGGDRASDPAFDLVDSDGRLHGPFNAMVICPAIGGPLSRLGEALRFHGTLSGRSREIVILTVAAVHGSEYELYAHERAGRRSGLTDGEIENLVAGRSAPTFDETETVVHDLALRLASRSSIAADAFDAISAHLSEPTIVEISTLVGYYAMLALQLDLFDVKRPAM